MTFTMRVIVVAVVLASASSAEAARKFRCAGGDAACVIASIEESNADDRDTVLLLGRGVYTLDPATYPSLLPDGLTSTGRLTIKGVGADRTIIQRAAEAPPFRILTSHSRLTIEGVSILGGDASDTSCACGGGIFSTGVLTIIDSRVLMNRSSGPVEPNQNKGYGGGIAATGPLMIFDSLVSLNRSATEGAGIRAAGGATIIGSTISANAGQDGGGISAGMLTIIDSAIIGNSGRFGGGIFNEGSPDYTLTNTTIAENRASFGGAIQVGIPDAPPGFSRGGVITIANSTLSGNRGTAGAGGIGGPPLGNPANDVMISLRGTILAQNSNLFGPSDCGGAVSLTSLGHNLIGACTRITLLPDTDLTGDPVLGSLVDDGSAGNAHLPLLSDSPAIDAGETAQHSHEADCPPRDQIGQRRVGACDIGAIEFQPSHHHKVVR